MIGYGNTYTDSSFEVGNLSEAVPQAQFMDKKLEMRTVIEHWL